MRTGIGCVGGTKHWDSESESHFSVPVSG